MRQRIKAVLQYVVALGHRPDNPAGEALNTILSKRNGGAKHHRALPHREVAAVVETIRASRAGMAVKLAFEFLILTAARSGEVRLAAWTEIDGATWTVPAVRMKARREHRVPLCDRAVSILAEARALEDSSGLIFPGTREGKPLSDMTLTKLMRELGFDAVPHGFRSSFRDWAAECTNAPHAVMGAALAHAVSNKTEAAYNRTDLFERRRAIMEQWAAYLAGGAKKVVSLHG